MPVWGWAKCICEVNINHTSTAFRLHSKKLPVKRNSGPEAWRNQIGWTFAVSSKRSAESENVSLQPITQRIYKFLSVLYLSRSLHVIRSFFQVSSFHTYYIYIFLLRFCFVWILVKSRPAPILLLMLRCQLVGGIKDNIRRLSLSLLSWIIQYTTT